ncbi:MAG: response regulator [Proteobacteria bacterium]|nr:response regulator [Pseudomonadota bacterium]MBU1389875.1 response regulator [Pseudomonadota bacterium]MBU1543884.1 response regulator [Pseudomonadota bacterium]MBU2429709.1 response regulator [Pseudomonadota bacterium]MBU2482237.1 response regulator [Pseudomonadota bacterium]
MTQILLISPEKDIFKAVENCFSENQIATAWTDTAAKALLMLSDGKFDLIILHEHLQDMNGRQLVEAIITQNAMLNCVVLSELSKEDFHEAYEGLGVLMQFSLTPTHDNARALIDYMARIKIISNRPHRITGDTNQ